MDIHTKQLRRSFDSLEQRNEFIARHIGPDEAEQAQMLKFIGFDSM
jgi:hypothetical protein